MKNQTRYYTRKYPLLSSGIMAVLFITWAVRQYYGVASGQWPVDWFFLVVSLTGAIVESYHFISALRKKPVVIIDSGLLIYKTLFKTQVLDLKNAIVYHGPWNLKIKNDDTEIKLNLFLFSIWQQRLVADKLNTVTNS